MQPERPLHETHVCRDCGAEITLPYAKPDALALIRALRITADDIDRALASLGPTGDRAEAYVKVAAQAAAAALRALGTDHAA